MSIPDHRTRLFLSDATIELGEPGGEQAWVGDGLLYLRPFCRILPSYRRIEALPAWHWATFQGYKTAARQHGQFSSDERTSYGGNTGEVPPFDRCR
jgi:hypothetical protein